MRTIQALKMLIAAIILALALIACDASFTSGAATPAPADPPTTLPEPTSFSSPEPTDAPAATDAPSEPTPEPTATPSAPTPTLVPLEANSFPSGDSFGDELAFQTIASDPRIGTDNGAGIASVTFQIVDSQGNQVHESTDNNALYCAFGEGNSEQECGVWRFSEHNNTWPSGTAVENGGSYQLQVTVEATSGQQTKQDLDFRIELP